MQRQVFRQYDIRGKVGSEFFIDQVYKVIRAFIYYAQDKTSISSIVIGYDARIHSPEIAQEVLRACLELPVQVYWLGMVTTPMQVYAQHVYSASIAIMVTASHNPESYNGLKLYCQQEAVEGDELAVIYQMYIKELADQQERVQGQLHQVDIAFSYISYITKRFDFLKNQSVPVVFDVGCGAAKEVLPALISYMGWTDSLVLCGNNFVKVHEADPTKYENISHAIVCAQSMNKQAVLAFDGDADRLVAATSSGNLLAGDELLALFAGQLGSELTVVADIKTSFVVEQVGAQVFYAPTGAHSVLQMMRDKKALIAGEVSGHYFFADAPYVADDGIYAALELLGILYKQSVMLEVLYQALPERYTSCEYRISVDSNQQESIMGDVAQYVQEHEEFQVVMMDGIRFYDSTGWALFRKSHTEPLLSIRCEGIDSVSYEKYKEIIKSIVQPYGLHMLIK